MIDLLDTPLGDKLRKTRILSEAVAWLQMFTPELKSEIIKEWVQRDQLKGRGVDSNNEVIGHYSAFTDHLTNGFKAEGDHYTLEDTGDFYASMFVMVFQNEIEITGDSSKMQDQDWWREEILGLTDESIEKLIQKAREHYPAYVRRVLELD